MSAKETNEEPRPSPDVICSFSRAGLFLKASLSSLETLEYPREELLGREFFSFIDPHDRARVEAIFRADHQAEATCSFEALWICKDGNTKRLVWSGLWVGEGFAAVGREVVSSERREALARVRRLNRLYAVSSGVNIAIARIRESAMLYNEACRLVVEQGRLSMAWVCLCERNGEVRMAAVAGQNNGYVEELLQQRRIVGFSKSLAGIALESGRTAVCNDITHNPSAVGWPEGALERGYSSVAAFPLKLSGKTIGLLLIYADQVDFFKDEELHLLEALAEDLSFAIDSADKERKRQRALEKLKASQQTLSAVLSNLPGVAFRAGPDGRWDFVSDGCFSLTGYSAEQLIGGITLEQLICPEDREPTAKLIASALAELKAYDATYRIQTADGTQKWVWERGRGFYNENGKLLRLEGFLSDITERKKLEMQILRTQRMESIGTLAGGIAHDLNNILTPILMSVGLLRMRLQEPHDVAMLETLEQNAKRGAEMVRQILSFARGVEGKGLVIHPCTLLQEVAKMARETFPRSIRIQSDCTAEVRPLKGDPTQIHQVLLNLCVNARDAMPEGGQLSLSARNVRVGTGMEPVDPAQKSGDYVLFEVSDTGTGMDSTVRERLFEPFFTTKEIGKGTGLGLSTTLVIVKSHKGFIDLSSEPGVGTRFRVFFPAHSEKAAPARPHQPESFPKGNGEAILVVDDEPNILALLSRTLQSAGYTILTASNGAQACELYAQKKETIAAVITDMMMPGMDGPALVQSLLSINPRARILGLSGLADDERVAKAEKLGMTAFLAKPFSFESLLRAVGALLGK